VSARRVVAFLCAVMAMGAIPDARGQTPASPPVEGNIYSVTYVEVMPTSTTAALAVLTRYREAASRADGNLRSEVAQRIGEPHEFVVLEVWKDRAAFEAHGKGASSTDMRERIAAIRNAPTDERVHTALSVGRVESKMTRGAIYVVTHVDVIPPRKDDGVAAVRQLGDDSRQHVGNLRFEVVQQTNRPNHFTVVEIWKDAKALEAHSMAPATRQFRDKLAPATGALYDERKYNAVD
jgi:quinol monooxygenase YgiN